MDMLRYQTASANARQWSSDLACRDPPSSKAIRAYSPVHNVKAGTCYPPTLVTTADHDDRVVPSTATSSPPNCSAQSCPNPVMIRIETRAGHGAGKPVWMQIEDIADQFGFVANALKMPAPVEGTAGTRPGDTSRREELAGAKFAGSGKVRRTRVPRPSTPSSTVALPGAGAAASRTMARPRPAAGGARGIARAMERSNTWARSAAGIPTPVSPTSTTRIPGHATAQRSRCPGGRRRDGVVGEIAQRLLEHPGRAARKPQIQKSAPSRCRRRRPMRAALHADLDHLGQ